MTPSLKQAYMTLSAPYLLQEESYQESYDIRVK